MKKNWIKVSDIIPNNNSETIINKISEIRTLNNSCWMVILQLAFSTSPKEAKKIFKQITDNDKKINKLSRELCK